VIRVLLVDDHPVVRAGFCRLLEQAGDIRVVAEAGDGDAGYAAFVAHAPDVVVSDLSMAGGGGLDLVRRILLRDAQAHILIFSMHDGGLLVRRALAAGARGFVTKGSAPERLVGAIHALHEGGRYLDPGLSADDVQGKAAADSERLAMLSGREFDVFRLLAQGRTAAQCAQELKLSPKTIANYQTAIKEKLEVSTLAALAHLALRHRVIGGMES
jgi:DNA-binding NarL/FixJ family response regulator